MTERTNPLANKFIKADKITNYLLSETVPDHKYKYGFFKSFGFSDKIPAALIDALERHAEDNPIVEVWSDEWGIHYEVVGPLRSPDGRNPTVQTSWMLDHGSSGPVRFITAFPA